MLTSDAIISDDKKYRYLLTRIGDNDKRMVNFIGLNPSTADQIDNDPTMRRCIAFSTSTLPDQYFAERYQKLNAAFHLINLYG